MDNYRIYRTDTRNIAIQKKRGNEWRTISYHGNNLNSLVLGLFDLIMSQHTPADENLLYALENVQLTLVSGIEKIKELVEEHWDE